MPVKSTTSGGRLVKLSALLTVEQLEEVERLADMDHATRADVIRRLVGLGLRARRVGDAATTAALEAVV